MRYKGTYRIMCEYDTRTNQFPRKLDGTYEDIDCYISCQKDIRIYHCGKQILYVYIPSIGRGRNIIKAINNDLGEGIINNIEQTDTEILFKFNSKYMEQLEPYLKPKTSGANISPYSTKNLPKTKYIIPDEELIVYKEIISEIKERNMLIVSKIINKYIKIKGIKDDIKRLNIKPIEYLYMKNEFEEFLIYLKKEVKNYNLQKNM